MSTKDFYHYKKIDGDEEESIAADMGYLFGYSKVEPLVYTDEYIYLSNSIEEQPGLYEIELPKGVVNIRKVKKSISYWHSLGIKLHDVNKLSNSKTKIIRVHPSKIPVVYIDDDEAGLIIHSFSEEGYEDASVTAINYIFLPRKDETFISVGSYNHEITHSQLVSLKGSCEDYLNCEALPIFMEMLFSDYYDKSGNTVDLLTRWRLMLLKDRLKLVSSTPDMTYMERTMLDSYVQSIIEAVNLTNIYYGKSDVIKKEILSDINRVFSGKSTVEGVLMKYDSDIGSVPKDLKYLRRTFQKNS